jgi:hypothetical protein
LLLLVEGGKVSKKKREKKKEENCSTYKLVYMAIKVYPQYERLLLKPPFSNETFLISLFLPRLQASLPFMKTPEADGATQSAPIFLPLRDKFPYPSCPSYNVPICPPHFVLEKVEMHSINNV